MEQRVTAPLVTRHHEPPARRGSAEARGGDGGPVRDGPAEEVEAGGPAGGRPEKTREQQRGCVLLLPGEGAPELAHAGARRAVGIGWEVGEDAVEDPFGRMRPRVRHLHHSHGHGDARGAFRFAAEARQRNACVRGKGGEGEDDKSNKDGLGKGLK